MAGTDRDELLRLPLVQGMLAGVSVMLAQVPDEDLSRFLDEFRQQVRAMAGSDVLLVDVLNALVETAEVVAVGRLIHG